MYRLGVGVQDGGVLQDGGIPSDVAAGGSEARRGRGVKALTWQGTGKVFVETVPDLRIQEPTDAIVRMTSTATCGSDLHLYDVLGMYLEAGDSIGHEPMGVVEADGCRRGGGLRGHPPSSPATRW
jgi:hypothetical protein